jgi:hypothetical protein
MISTGIKGLDGVITGLRLGDNVVWQIDDIESYAEFVTPFVKRSVEDGRRVVYIRFARHRSLVGKDKRVKVYELDANSGFETFSGELNSIITKEGEGAFYVFDCLSDLLSAWSNDLMIGNFFKITCPYLFELNTIAYFGLLRNSHSYKTVARIRDTTQLLIDVYHFGGKRYIHPIKVWNRYTPSMFLPHVEKRGAFTPIESSVDTARLFASISRSGSTATGRKLDYWDRTFIAAEELSAGTRPEPVKVREMIDHLSRMIIARDEKMLGLAKRHLSLEDFLNIKSRMVGTGFIGGKSVGMLVARNILLKEKALDLENIFEQHDSFYIGSDVFYSYIVENGWWKARMEQRTREGYFEIAKTLREKLLAGSFPEEIKESFQRMMEYFGQSPIIVRSSSLLEDSYGNAFAGKYESVFLANQGTPEERYLKFIDAVRRIYASTMNEDALTYRLQRGLDRMDEQMALLVQRVSGSYHKDYFFPDAAGVGISFNAFVWKNTLDPRAGMLRLVAGLGTRAVNRVEGDYPRIAALDDPLLKAQAGIKDAQRFSQHDVDVINIRENRLQTISLRELVMKKIDLKLDMLGTRDDQATEKMREMGTGEEAWILTFDELLSKTPFVKMMQGMLKALEKAYGYPIDIEFTVNIKKDGPYKINLLQCRPVQTKGLGKRVVMPKSVRKERLIFQSAGNFLGGNALLDIDRIIYVDPKSYCALATQSERYDIARVVGILNRQAEAAPKSCVMLLGPGRWGTSTPSLGVPVTFAEINNISVLGEIAFATANAVPEISFGTHFFQDLVETGIFYVALYPDNDDAYLNQKFLDSISKGLRWYAPQYSKYENVVKIFDAKGAGIRIAADIVTQKVVCYFQR